MKTVPEAAPVIKATPGYKDILKDMRDNDAMVM
jgi:hypothetical protein